MSFAQKDFFSPKEKLKRKLIWWFRYHKYDLLPIIYIFILFVLVGLILTGVGYSFKADKPVTNEVKKESDYNTEVNKLFEHDNKMNELARQLNLSSPITEEIGGTK